MAVDLGGVTPWTHAVLQSTRRIYAGVGFKRVDTAMHDSFGEPEPGGTWRLDLRRPAAAA